MYPFTTHSIRDQQKSLPLATPFLDNVEMNTYPCLRTLFHTVQYNTIVLFHPKCPFYSYAVDKPLLENGRRKASEKSE